VPQFAYGADSALQCRRYAIVPTETGKRKRSALLTQEEEDGAPLARRDQAGESSLPWIIAAVTQRLPLSAAGPGIIPRFPSPDAKSWMTELARPDTASASCGMGRTNASTDADSGGDQRPATHSSAISWRNGSQAPRLQLRIIKALVRSGRIRLRWLSVNRFATLKALSK
jgi:hypothetical protein